MDRLKMSDYKHNRQVPIVILVMTIHLER